MPEVPKRGDYRFEKKVVETESVPIASVAIDMARHSIKGAKPREALTEEGVVAAVRAGVEHLRDIPEGEIHGSSRERTGQSSTFRMFGEVFDDVNLKDVDPEDVVRWIETLGVKKIETPFLNFQLGEGKYTDALMDAFKKNEMMKWLVETSDDAAVEYQQDPNKVTPLSIQAGNIGSFFFAKAWELYEKTRKGETVEKKMDFATSHQGVLESFLYKVILEHDGDAAANTFVETLSLPNQGFSENEGFRAEVELYGTDVKDPEQWGLHIFYKEKEYQVASNEAYTLIKEGQALKNTLAAIKSTK